MNQAIIIGRLTRDPEVRYTQSGTAVCTFTLAVDRPWAHSKDQQSNQPTADFIPVVTWRKLAEICGNNIDDDKNGMIDCKDPVCATHASCSKTADTENCSNALDDDGDGAIDCKLDGGFDSIGGNCNSVARAKTVPQIIANSAGEFKVLADAILQKGFTEIDFNMGCPFPMQVSRHRGAGLLNDTRTVQEIMDEIARLSAAGTARFSVKMRLGQDSPDEAFALLPILNDAPLTQITRLQRRHHER